MRTRELIVDSFAGGGGASLGIEWATGRSPDVAINHNPAAIAMHTANHPATRHYREDVFRVNPREVTRGRPVGLLWLSPDCTHFSRAKGGKPVKKSIRGLAWVAIKWAVEAGPLVMVLENVRELARAQGFPDGYQLTGTATNQVERIGNSVCPPVAEAVVRAQGFTPSPRRKRATAGVA